MSVHHPSLNNQQKKKLTQAYHILSDLGLDDHTYTHLSIRSVMDDSFYIYPFGLRFEEVTEESLMRVSFDGKILEGNEYQYNRTGYIIHGHIYEARPDINAVFHMHTPEIVAVSAMEKGLMPLSQWALHFYDQVSYHEYDSLALDDQQGNQLIQDLGENYTLLLRNHGSLTCGRTIQEAMFYTYHLQKACEAQIFALSMNQPLIIPSEKICRKTVRDLLSFEEDLGKRDWNAWVRRLARRAGEANNPGVLGAAL